jgi:tRNA (guanine-N7-)-methyltransferase
MINDPPYRQGAFFGRRKGHPLRARQADVFSTLLPRLAIDLTAAPPAGLATLFSIPIDDVRIEIGFGGGEHLLAQAQLHPGTGFIGCEPFVNGMAKALAIIDTQKIANIRLHPADAMELLDWLPDASIARVDLL